MNGTGTATNEIDGLRVVATSGDDDLRLTGTTVSAPDFLDLNAVGLGGVIAIQRVSEARGA